MVAGIFLAREPRDSLQADGGVRDGVQAAPDAAGHGRYTRAVTGFFFSVLRAFALFCVVGWLVCCLLLCVFCVCLFLRRDSVCCVVLGLAWLGLSRLLSSRLVLPLSCHVMSSCVACSLSFFFCAFSSCFC